MNRIELHNIDCMEYMKTVDNGYFELAIVDPPYGISDITGKQFSHARGKLKNRILSRDEKICSWDKTPTQDYFNELFRISKNQIIWGGNYFNLSKYRCPIVWDKCQPWENFSQIELAWASFNKPARIFKFDNRTGDKIHPTQKPIKLYEWLLTNYAQQGDKILDTHLGSMSSVVACINKGYDMVGCELDKDYFDNGINRVKQHINQQDMFRADIELIIK